MSKKGNLEWHFNTLHSKYQLDFPPNSEVRKRKLNELKSKLSAQQNLFVKPVLQSKAATITSFKISHLLAKKCKPFSDGEFIKDMFLEVSDVLFQSFKNNNEIRAAFQDLQLSRNTVMRRVEKMNENVSQQLQADISKCNAFSLQLDESTDISDTAQIIVIRVVFSDFISREEMLGMIPLRENQSPGYIQLLQRFCW